MQDKIHIKKLNEKSSERRKHCALAVGRRSQNSPPPATDPLPGVAGRPKFNQLETYKPSLVRIDARNFEISW